MTTNDLIINICKKYNLSKKDIADRIGAYPSNFNEKVMKDTLSMHELFETLKSVGVEMRLVVDKNNKVMDYDKSVLCSNVNVKSGVLFSVFEALGITPEYYADGEKIIWKQDELKKHHMNFRAMNNGEWFDTSKSTLLAKDFCETDPDIFGDDDVAKELYLDNDGRYFFAEYRRKGPVKNKVFAAAEKEAGRFILQNKEKHSA